MQLNVVLPIKRSRRTSCNSRTLPIRRLLSNPEALDLHMTEFHSPQLKVSAQTSIYNKSAFATKTPMPSLIPTGQGAILPIKPSRFTLQSARTSERVIKSSMELECESNKTSSVYNYESTPVDSQVQTSALKIKKTSIRRNSHNGMLYLKKPGSSTDGSIDKCLGDKGKNGSGRNITGYTENKANTEKHCLAPDLKTGVHSDLDGIIKNVGGSMVTRMEFIMPKRVRQ